MPTDERLLRNFLGWFWPRPVPRPAPVRLLLFLGQASACLTGEARITTTMFGRVYFNSIPWWYDAIVTASHYALVELGFTARDLAPNRVTDDLRAAKSLTVYNAVDAGQWPYTPKGYVFMVVTALARHRLEQYGEKEAGRWVWELRNGTDIFAGRAHSRPGRYGMAIHVSRNRRYARQIVCLSTLPSRVSSEILH